MSLFWLGHQAYMPPTDPTSSPPAADPFATVMAAAGADIWLRLGESSGTTATDEQATQNGTYVGTPTLGVSGYTGDGDTAVTLNGTSQYVELADNAVYDVGTNDFSLMIAASVPTWPSSAHATLMARGNGFGGGDYWVYLNYFLANRISFTLAGTTYNFDTGVTLAGSGFHLYGLSVDRSGDATLTVDGVARGGGQDVSGQSATNIDSARKLALGASSDPSAAYYLAATVDEFAFWSSTAVSTATFADIHAARVS